MCLMCTHVAGYVHNVSSQDRVHAATTVLHA